MGFKIKAAPEDNEGDSVSIYITPDQSDWLSHVWIEGYLDHNYLRVHFFF